MTIPASTRRLLLLGGLLVATAAAALHFLGDEAMGGTAAEPAPEPAPAAAPATRAARRAGTPRRAASVDSAPSAPSAPAAHVEIEREIYGYAPAGRRDPFRPLITTSALRPLASELRLVAVAYDPNGIGSVAILRDTTAKVQHRVRLGQLLGRMRVAQIRPRQVVFTVEELGYSRREVLALHDSTVMRLTRQP
jgi:hypothetical protein